MKKQIRFGIFETNSSSTHSLTIFTDEQYKKWLAGDLYCSTWGNNFITKEEYEKLNEDDRDDYYSYEELCNDYYFEVDEHKYTHTDGSVIHIVCKYGYDG